MWCKLRISELIDQLQHHQRHFGDVLVFTQGGCGCCLWSRDPEPEFYETDLWGYPGQNQPGIYL